jgi:O-antigen/teichoic acid export membrane protein
MFSQGRKKTFILGTVSHYGENIVSVIVGLVSVPIGLHYFGPVRYGIWAVISSIIGYLSLSNLGINSAAQVLIAKASKAFEQRAILLRSLFLLFISSAVVLVLITRINHFYPNSNWVLILGKIPLNLRTEAAEAGIATAILFLLNLPLQVFFAGFIGLQKIYWTKFYSSLGSIVALIALILTVLLKGNLVNLVIFRGISTISISIVCGLHLLFANPDLRQKINKPIDAEFSIKSIFVSGIRFFIIGIAAMVVWNTDNLVISHFLGVEAVTPYAIIFKVFTMTFSIFIAVNSTLFPMYGKASGLKQWDWIQQTYEKATQLLPIIGGLIWIGSVAFFREIIYIWAGSEAYSGILVVFALGGYGYMLSMVNIHASLLVGLNATKNMIYIGWAEAIANLGISIALVKPLGTGGVALGTFLASLLTVFWMLPLDIYKQTEGKVKFHFRPIFSHGLFILFPCLIASLFIYNYCQNEICKIFINIGIICTYLILSWRVMSPELQYLIKDASVKIYTRIKNLRVLNV